MCTVTDNLGCIYQLAQPKLERDPRRLMLKLSAEEVDISNIRTQGTIELHAQVLTKCTQCIPGAAALLKA